MSSRNIFELSVYLFGPEIFVGKANVIYLSDREYLYTNPGAMVLWTGVIALSGIVLSAAGLWIFFRKRPRRNPRNMTAEDNFETKSVLPPKINDLKYAAWLTFTPPVVFLLTVFLPGMSQNSVFLILFILTVIEIIGISLWLKIILFYRYRRPQSLPGGESATDLPQRKVTGRLKSCLGVIAAITGGAALIIGLLSMWHVAQRQTQYRVFGPFPEITVKPTPYTIDECNSLRLNTDAIAKDKLDNAHIEVRTGKVCFTLPCNRSQTEYDLGNNLIPGDKMTVFRGFNRGMTYGIMIVASGDDTLWSAQIHVADDWYKELYYTSICSIPAGTLILGFLLIILCLSGIYQLGFDHPGKQKNNNN